MSYRSSLNSGFDKCLAWLLQTPVLPVALIALLLCSPLLALSPRPACSPMLTKPYGCVTALAVTFWKCSSIDSYFSNLRMWFLSPSFVTALKALCRTATCLLAFPWKGKIVLLLQNMICYIIARNPNQCCCLPYFLPGNILVCLVLTLSITSIPSKPTDCFCSDVCHPGCWYWVENRLLCVQ